MVDKEALAALRAKYADAKGSDVFDPEFKKVVSLVFKSSGSRKLPFSGVSTFLGASYRPEAAEQADFGGHDISVAFCLRFPARFGHEIGR